ncbi:MAG: NnrS family protein [Sterolibacteriaceae bacterium MAG5]|nr:NnrS family protein [Candidatus Nitricoxidireducens bremensis]
MRFLAHPLWLAGFRPFFALVCLAGAVLPALWIPMYAGWIEPPAGIAAVHWHAHEMFFGFGWAVLGGFLLTSTKNWVGIRGYHGGALALPVAAWLFERAGMVWGAAWPPVLFLLSAYLFTVLIVAMLLTTLVRHRATDSYRDDNYVFFVILPLLPVAKALMLDPAGFAAGSAMALALFRVAFLVMLERTLSQFMKGVFQVSILRHPALDTVIKLLAIAMIASPWMPAGAAALAGILLALLLALRFVFWKPLVALRRLDVGIMHLGYLAIVVQLLLDAASHVGALAWVGAFSVHVFTFGAMGFIVPAMLVRISKGHTGRKVVFETADRFVLWLMIAAFLLRVAAPQLFPQAYLHWIAAAAACWCAGFAILGWRYIPFLLRPRVDGKEH